LINIYQNDVFNLLLAEATLKSKQVKSESENVANAVTTFLEMIKARPEQMISFVTTGLSYMISINTFFSNYLGQSG
jgi:hypothetical protein